MLDQVCTPLASACPFFLSFSRPSVTFQKSWMSASSRPHVWVRQGSTGWSPSPGWTATSWWVLVPVILVLILGEGLGSVVAEEFSRAGSGVSGAV